MSDLINQMSCQLKTLRMSGLLGTLSVRTKQAMEQQLSYTEFLALILQDEFERRESKKLTQRLRRANFRGEKTLESFNFEVKGLKMNKSLVFELSSCNFIEEHSNVLIVGPTGVGKSHIARAIGHIACRKGYDVYCTSTAKLLKQLRASRADGTYDRKIQNLSRYDVLVLDDLGLKPFEPPEDENFHDIICERYEKGSIIVTSNLDFDEWSSVFPNRILACATIDRLRDKAYRLLIEGESYRKPRPMN